MIREPSGLVRSLVCRRVPRQLYGRRIHALLALVEPRERLQATGQRLPLLDQLDLFVAQVPPVAGIHLFRA